MEWLSVEWITANWIPLLVTLILGFILGWLFTGLSPRRKNAELEARLAEMESKSRKAERDLVDARKQVDSLKTNLSNAESTLSGVREQLGTAQSDLQQATEEKAALMADAETRVGEAQAQLAQMREEAGTAAGIVGAELDGLRGALESANAKLVEVSTQRDVLAAELAALKAKAGDAIQSMSAKEAALNEAYTRITNLQRVLEERETALTAATTELDGLRSDVSRLGMLKNELEDRLQRARGDVAGEMAILTSTMVKMKDDALTAANVRIVDLTNQLAAIKSQQAAG